jgi:hypothetical protein
MVEARIDSDSEQWMNSQAGQRVCGDGRLYRISAQLPKGGWDSV